MKPTILYVDDEKANLRGFKSVFRRDYNILLAESGEEALQILEDNNCDLIITDQRMPKMTGVQFLKQVSSKIPHTPPNRMILSGYSKNEDIELAREKFGLSSFMSKPWTSNELKSKIEELLH